MSSIHAVNGTAAPVAAGWYSDPSGGRQARWWDGEQWTAHVQALPMGEPPEDAWVTESRLIPAGSTWASCSLGWGIAAVVLNFLMAPTVMSFIFGVLALRRHSRFVRLGYEVEGRGKAVLGIVLGAAGILITGGWIIVLRLVTHGAA